MKSKIKAALQRAYNNLGLGDEVFERVATAAETFITDEAQIENYVKGAESVLKMFQSEADKARAAKKRADELDAKLKEQNPPANPPKDEPTPPAPEPNPAPTPATPDITELIKSAVAQAVNPLTEKINAYEAERASESVINTVKSKIETDYVNSYKREKQAAWKMAIKLYEKGGKKSTAEELEKDFFDEFNDMVVEKGGKIGEPLKDDNGGQGSEPNLDAVEAMLRASGKLPAK